MPKVLNSESLSRTSYYYPETLTIFLLIFAKDLFSNLQILNKKILNFPKDIYCAWTSNE